MENGYKWVSVSVRPSTYERLKFWRDRMGLSCVDDVLQAMLNACDDPRFRAIVEHFAALAKAAQDADTALHYNETELYGEAVKRIRALAERSENFTRPLAEGGMGDVGQREDPKEDEASCGVQQG